jgi:orotate phosphoribosyltransferase
MNPSLGARDGHFMLESGMHTDRWFDLDALFCEPSVVGAQIERLGGLLAHYVPDAICGPMIGGALLAQAVATRMGLRFFYSQRVADDNDATMFAARYALPHGQQPVASGRRVAIVDDMVSAGSSVRATHRALIDAGASVVVVGTLHLSGDVAKIHFDEAGIPLVAVKQRPFNLWSPDACPLCRIGQPLTNPEG